jgi:predicted ATP-dependent endonuclease of OLD family
MLAAFCTLAENEIVCLEEPEIHLHPLLQRKLIRYLHGETNNQYFVATHSSAMLDVVPSVVFAVTQQHGETHIRLASTPNDKFEICRALGYQASDLLQSNAIIWVEGPSDRIYLLHWIKAVAPDLVEGIDFSVMFYGGRLLSHLSAEDEEVGEFIALRRLNRNVAVVMDSDKSSSHAHVNATKKRIIAELGQDGFVWLTAGREIENYILPSLLANAVCSVSGIESSQLRSMGQYDHAYKYKDKKGYESVADKIKIARAVAAEKADLSVLDLRKRVDELVAFIRNSSAQGRHDDD